MKAIDPKVAVYIWQGAMDMRVSFDRLSMFIKENLSDSSITSSLYVFLSRNRDRVKILYWDRDGYALWYKRLEAGTFKVEQKLEYDEITGVDLSELLAGMDLSRIKLRKSAESGLYS
jgi:transposase